MSSKKLLNNGMYDQAVAVSAKKIRKKPTKEKQITVLSEAYRLANQRDNDRINFLRTEGSPDIWTEVFDTYSRMKNRQEVVRTLPGDILTRINYKFINYDQEIIAAKQKAAEFHYIHAIELMKNNEKIPARKAYEDLLKVKEYYSTYKDVEYQLGRARALGMSNVLFKMQNQAAVVIPTNFEEELCKISLYELNSFWVNFDTKFVKDRKYDYTILVNMKFIDVSPESMKEIHTDESKEIQDGWQYVLDKNGNVVKDSLGNDMKVPKYKTITAHIIEYQMKKAAKITGTIDFISGTNGQLIKGDPITTEYFFDHFWLQVTGDMNALKEETKKRLGNKPMPFPSSFDMLLQAAQILKNMTKDIIYNNKGIFL
jgi:hypothetical protein